MSHKHHALINILESIAAEETALASIVEAEAHKMRAFVEALHHFPQKPTVDDFVTFNTVVNRLLLTILAEQIALLNKLDVTTSLIKAEEEKQQALHGEFHGPEPEDMGNDEEAEGEDDAG